jgi:hypothetical protein
MLLASDSQTETDAERRRFLRRAGRKTSSQGLLSNRANAFPPRGPAQAANFHLRRKVSAPAALVN